MKNTIKTLAKKGYKVSSAGHWVKDDGTLVPVTLIQSLRDGITVGGCKRKVKRHLRRLAAQMSR